MIEFGNTLRAAREAKGLTIAQIADTTHMMSSIVEDLENEKFTRIVAPIYGRGFVKLYCETVGLDPKPLIAEFMDIYNGNREVQIKERPISAPPIPPPEPTPPAESVESASMEANVSPEIPPAAIPEAIVPEPLQIADDLFAAARTPVNNLRPTNSSGVISPAASATSRYGTPFHDDEQSRRPNLSPSVWRIALLGIIAIAIVWGLLVGVRSLYQMTSSAPSAATAKEPDATATETSSPTKDINTPPATPTAKGSQVKRAPMKIPSLYID